MVYKVTYDLFDNTMFLTEQTIFLLCRTLNSYIDNMDIIEVNKVVYFIK